MFGLLGLTECVPSRWDYSQHFETARAASEEQRQSSGLMRWLYRKLTLGLLFRRPKLMRNVGCSASGLVFGFGVQPVVAETLATFDAHGA